MNKKQRLQIVKYILTHYRVKKCYLFSEFGLMDGSNLLLYALYHSFLDHVNQVIHKASNWKVFFVRRPPS